MIPNKNDQKIDSFIQMNLNQPFIAANKINQIVA